MEKRFPIRNPWQLVDYASNRGGESSIDNGSEALSDLPLIDCGLGDSPFGPPVELKQLLESSIKNGDLNEAIWKYPPDRFCEQPTRLIRERFGLSENPIIVFHGEGSYGLLSKIILELPDLTTVEELGILGIGPQFPNIVGLAEKHGQKSDGVLRFPYISVKPDLDSSLSEKIEALIKERGDNNGYRFIYLDNPNNPTGDFASREIVEKLVQFALNHHDVVIIDEAYGDALPDDQSAIPLTEKYPNLIVIRGVAKIIGAAGLRVGYGVFSKEIGEIFQSLQLVFGVSGPQQLIINELLKPEVLNSHVSRVRQKIRSLKSQLTSGLRNLGIKIFPTHPDVPIFLAQRPGNLFQQLKQCQIVTERGSDFRATYPLDDSFVRMRIPATFEEVEEILKRVKEILNNI